MNTRTQNIKQLLENFQSFRHAMVFRTAGSRRMPRITPSQWGVLMVIERCSSVRGHAHAHEQVQVKDVAKALRITSSAATQLVDGLVESGYVLREKSADDRRTVALMLSKKSKTKLEKIKKQGLQKLTELFKGLTDRELVQYVALNKKIIEPIINKK